ncbi:MAG: mannose-1-phosphate guanylyltransferase/mannose-6-phosphate isomerase [Xanthobacteraceae bacterium]|nr:mannose-1-phosphate guanylyltransferase/mannose-6-phosphate isomerase [Xanthobacteraceae bacterium]MCW5679267.1 mannose-1-phosphate guanylyltransferase/mannose-6-phosphate isomerase [Xanthobacteraceae bacterium]
MSDLIRPVILSGGAGTRLWPASRDSLPKQFLKLLGERSTLQETLLRVSDGKIFGKPVIVANHAYRFLVREQLQEIGIAADIILEPARRDSGPAIAAATQWIAKEKADALVLVLAADHVVTKPKKFAAICKQARAAAKKGNIVTFGITPDHPATGYGYIRPGKTIAGAAPARTLDAFIEKPDAKTAAKYLKKKYLWNSGNFMFRADVLLEEYARHDKATIAATKEAIDKADTDLGFLLLDANAFKRTTKKSIDYAVMEKTKRAAVIPAEYGWSDFGGWGAAWTLSRRDRQGNAARGPVAMIDATNNYVSSDGKLTTLVGAENLVVVVTDDAVLVADRARAEDLKKLVEKLRAEKREEADTHAKVHRPWGNYQSLDRGERYQVKRIVVNPGGRLSLQKHAHRAEHWVVVHGTALVTIGDEKKTLKENESVYVPLGAVHRLENPGTTPVELIEVQSGNYLGEDDIVRLEDVYRRTEKD